MESEEKNFGWLRNDSAEAVQFEIKEFDQSIYLVNQENEVIEVPSKGSLGIMALGYQGHIAWKKARELEKTDG